MSNMMIEDTTIKFIDPRGYFGKTKIFGLSEYDIGKILYSLSGFDIFNNDEKFCFYISNTNIDIPVKNVINNFIHLFEGYDSNTNKLLWKATRVDLIFGSNSQLRAYCEVYASLDAQDAFISDFIKQNIFDHIL
jgi:hypothetical protein